MTDLRGNAVTGRQRLASDLRRHRQLAGRTIEDVAAHLECSPAKVSRMETGIVGVRIQDLRAILAYYEVAGAERELLVALGRQARERGWWQAYADVVPPDSARLFGLEDGAETITIHTTSLVPGLFQTHGYMLALMTSSARAGDAAVARRVELRQRRQQVLTRERGPRVELLLDEAVLCRAVGGAAVFGAQLDHLLDAGTRPAVALRVVPFTAGVHSSMGAGYTIFGFDPPTVTPVVYLEQLSRNTYLDDPDEIAIYRAAVEDVRAAALPEGASLELIAARRAALEP